MTASPIRSVRHRRRLRHPSLWLGLLILALVLLPAALSVVWTPYPPGRLDILHRLASPSSVHLLGTDPFGRDLLSILMAGAANSTSVCVAAIAAAFLVGVPLGLAAASPGWRSAVVMRATDLCLAFPPLLTAAMIVAAKGPGAGGEILAIGVFNIPAFVRLTRSASLSVLNQDFVAAARIAGRGRVAVLAHHVLPNIVAMLLVQVTLALAVAELSEAGLSYLGLGLPPPLPSLGRALADYQTRIFDDPLLVVAPGAVVALLVLGFNLLGDGVRDLLDPTLPHAP
ncbi:ABC transporter permease [Lichenicola sp.]|uniref:ABC transporter permease n=1 Tax=Lichenicola sp. TaxID=2804529 RepID=UPI003B005406